MAEDQYNPDDEYKLSEPDTVSAYSTEASSGGAASDSDMMANIRKFALIGIGLLIVVFVVYKLMHEFYPKISTRKNVLPDVRLTQKPKAQATIPQSIVAAKPTVVTPKKPIAVTRAPTVGVAQLQNVQTDVQINKENISDANNKLTDIQNTLSNLDTKLGSMTDEMTRLTSQIDSQSNTIASLKRRLQARARIKKKVRRTNVVRQQARYEVQAIIPGRAWLKASDGSTITVSRNSRVPGYGVVRMIDPHQGVVTTSTGSKIRFGNE